jgi:hypothetical protein
MNSSELRGYKNFNTNVIGMVPGLNTDSPLKSKQPSPNRFHTRGCPDDEDGAATAMQRRWRGERSRRLVQELREYLALTAQLARWRRREAAALVIQSWTRGMHARIEYRSRYDAVIKLQAGMRGALARRRARTRRLEVAAEKAEAERLAAEAAAAAVACTAHIFQPHQPPTNPIATT